MRKAVFIILFYLLHAAVLTAQYPQYLSYDNETGLPSNEVYSIIQDNQGFIWIGSDAGLYRFDGVRFTGYKSAAQKMKSIASLTLSSSGRLYSQNFQSQIFYVEKDSLYELKHSLNQVINLASDREGNLFVSHENGVSKYSEGSKSWQHFTKLTEGGSKSAKVGRTSRGSLLDIVSVVDSEGIAEISGGKWKRLLQDNFFQKSTIGYYEIEQFGKSLWIFGKQHDKIYHFLDGILAPAMHSQLNSLLRGRKITSVRRLSDGNLWICTYKGVICFNPEQGILNLYYPDLSFSDSLLDREGNYWFTTLQDGIIRVPSLHFIVWARGDKLMKIAQSKHAIFFADQRGKIGSMDKQTEKLAFFYPGIDADVQSFDYDRESESLWFNINGHLFRLKEDRLTSVHGFGIQAIKTVLNRGDQQIAGSSSGLYVNGQRINSYWSRQILKDGLGRIWIATNKGLIRLSGVDADRTAQNLLFADTQILSMDWSSEENLLYVLTFKGEVFTISPDLKVQSVLEIPDDKQVNKILNGQTHLFISTNKGLVIYEKATAQLSSLGKISGVVSEHIQDMVLDENNLWLATVKGLQKIPVAQIFLQIPQAVIFLNGNLGDRENLKLRFNERLTLQPEVVHYSSHGKYEYAYRINKQDWIRLPATMSQIEIQNLPAGDFTMELKAIDFRGVDSANTIILNGYVSPPFWKTSWFVMLLVVAAGGLVFVLVRRRIKYLNEKQSLELERVQLENALLLSRETALKSQMNPHFVFNVLNSIKAYIYRNDKQKASEYLNKFSDLIRTFLTMSHKASISLADEVKMLDLYIGMEAMLLKEDFSYEKEIAPGLNLPEVVIPSLLIQPFVENAFKHGLHHKLHDKKLKLKIYRDEEGFIVVEIADNGVGRTAAAEIRPLQKQYESFATSAIEKRINLLNKQGSFVRVRVEDLFNEQNQPAGTRVILTIKPVTT